MCAMTGSLVQIGKVGEIADGKMKEAEVNGKPLLLARVQDRYFVAQGRCPHMGGILSKGVLEGTVVTCPMHHSQFDLTDGHVIRWTDWTGLKLSFARLVKSPRALKMYPVKIDGDRIMVEI